MTMYFKQNIRPRRDKGWGNVTVYSMGISKISVTYRVVANKESHGLVKDNSCMRWRSSRLECGKYSERKQATSVFSSLRLYSEKQKLFSVRYKRLTLDIKALSVCKKRLSKLSTLQSFFHLHAFSWCKEYSHSQDMKATNRICWLTWTRFKEKSFLPFFETLSLSLRYLSNPGVVSQQLKV